MRRLVALFNPGLPPRVWLLQLGVLVNFLGNGMVAPFLVIYLHFGRGIPLGFAGAAVALGGITAVTSGLVAGSLTDRLGSRNILVAAMVCNAAAYLLYTRVTVSWEAFAVGLLVGVGTGSYGPSSQNLTASMVPIESRAVAFAQNRVTAIIGLGAGALIGGLLARKGLDGYLQLLTLDAVTFLAFAVIALLLPSGRVRAPAQAGGYAGVIRDRPFVRLVGVNIALVAAGIAPMLVLLPAYAKVQAHVGETTIGAIYAINTLTIVVAQLPISRLTRGRSRMRVLRLAALIWVGSWLVCLGAGASRSSTVAAALIVVAAATNALGECMYTAIMIPTAAALAPDHLRGRYLGAMGLAWQGGFLIGPSIGGVVLGVFPPALPLVCAAGCLVAALGTAAVDRTLAEGLRRSPFPAAA
ncbi:MAG TPA: MFS transporter [Candidatus Limnocylindrales bacterium]|nr:MFS transporter [Candidatus Limnocylindrales bacterium]